MCAGHKNTKAQSAKHQLRLRKGRLTASKHLESQLLAGLRIGDRLDTVSRGRDVYPALLPESPFFEKRPKSGMLTAIDEKRPMTTFRPVSEEYTVFIYEEVIFTWPVTKGPPPSAGC